MKVSALKNLQNLVHRTVKHLAGCFSVVYRLLEMPSMEGNYDPHKSTEYSLKMIDTKVKYLINIWYLGKNNFDT